MSFAGWCLWRLAVIEASFAPMHQRFMRDRCYIDAVLYRERLIKDLWDAVAEEPLAPAWLSRRETEIA
jgi:hypothetical protein